MCSPVLTTSCGSTSCLIDSSREGMTPSVLYPMSSKTSSRSTLTMVPSTMSPSLKYLMVSSIAARNASSDPMSLTATLGVELACVLLVMCGLAPDADREVLDTPQNRAPQNDQNSQDLPEPARADHGTPGGRQPGHMT